MMLDKNGKLTLFGLALMSIAMFPVFVYLGIQKTLRDGDDRA